MKTMLISGGNVFCVPEYPPIADLRIPQSGYEGFSSHVPSWKWVQTMAVICGWEYLEVHVKRDHYPDNYCPIDNAVSITMSELAELCRRLKP